MRLATILALALCVAAHAPIAAVASERVTGMHAHRVHRHHVARGSFNPATALAPFALVPVVPPARSHDDTNGLSRNSDDCNYGCIDNGR
jgi:hypothetical protein